MSIKECVRCSAATKQGRGPRCKNTTCVYSEFCSAHTKSLFDLALKTSGIPNAGKGLFTTIEIPKNRNISRYTGDIKTTAAYNADPSGYAVSISKNRVVDGASTQSALGRYANDCRRSNRSAGQCSGPNARLVVSYKDGQPIIWLRATKKIKANSEVFVSYGREYWQTPKTKAPKIKQKSK